MVLKKACEGGWVGDVRGVGWGMSGGLGGGCQGGWVGDGVSAGLRERRHDKGGVLGYWEQAAACWVRRRKEGGGEEGVGGWAPLQGSDGNASAGVSVEYARWGTDKGGGKDGVHP